jgi:hemoglobin
MKDLENKTDLAFFLRLFYEKMTKDVILMPFFQDLNFEEHLPQIVHFWDFVLFGGTGYTSNMMQKHSHMPLTLQAFERWLHYFNETLEENFSGQNTSAAKQRAWVIAETMKAKMLADN